MKPHFIVFWPEKGTKSNAFNGPRPVLISQVLQSQLGPALSLFFSSGDISAQIPVTEVLFFNITLLFLVSSSFVLRMQSQTSIVTKTSATFHLSFFLLKEQ